MTRILRPICLASAAAALAFVSLSARPQTPTQPPAPPAQQPSDVITTINSGDGAPPRFAVPDFIALSPDTETAAIAKTIGQVLFDDLNFEREFSMIPRDTYATIPAAKAIAEIPFDRWRELGADAVLMGTVQKVGNTVHVEARLFNMKTRQSVFGKGYDGSAANARVYAHTIANEIYQQQRALKGVALTKLTFDSDRDGERMIGTVENRGVKEIYISDYDGENQRRVTTGRSLNITPRWSPDARSIAYTSYRHGAPNIFISNIYQGTLEELTKGNAENWLPAWSPDGTRIAFSSPRSGNAEIYVVNRDGTNVRQITNNPGIDTTPTWSPSGTQIAFVSDRTGTPQIYVVGADGLDLRKITSESYADRPTWSPAPYNEIAYTSRTGPGNDIKVKDLASGEVRQLTFGEGTNESPAFAPNGRHIAFMSTRSGKAQIFIIARDGKNLKQVTKAGNNYQPDWSK
ncbi:MAG TPA: Tol-Pal system beta propeller repeat protein TolB [Vicinamibacterales bacterium]|nr:Tol-Pal system beta propeller repeat protein TolB [Vicinamibacterales bacterium]